MPAHYDLRKIKDEADFAKILSSYGFVVPRGKRQLSLHCPFCEASGEYREGRGSLSVNLEERVWNCHRCDAHGNVLDFVIAMEKQAGRTGTVHAAARAIVNVCGLTGVEQARRGRQRRAQGRRGPETAAKEPFDAAPAVRAAPTASGEPEEVNPSLGFTLKLDPAHPYLRERGLSAETVEAFGLGYCGRGLMKGRVCIPIHDAAGELVAYAGRWAGPEAELPEGEDRYKLPSGFEKLRVLFNLHRVVSEHIVLVEGFFGVFRLHALGVPVVALMGHVLSEHHVALLEGAGVRRLTLLLDGDEPGRRSCTAIMGRLGRTPFLTRALVLPEGAQPDTVPEPYLRDLLGLRV